MILDEEVYLEHFGVKGMRWGHRKPRDEEERKRRFSKSGRNSRKRESLRKSIKDLEESIRIFEDEVKNAKTDKDRRGAQGDLDWAREELAQEKRAYSRVGKGKTLAEKQDTIDNYNKKMAYVSGGVLGVTGALTVANLAGYKIESGNIYINHFLEKLQPLVK